MTKCIKVNFVDKDIQLASARGTGPTPVCIHLSVSGTELFIEKDELLDLLTLINQKEEQIKTQLKRDEK